MRKWRLKEVKLSTVAQLCYSSRLQSSFSWLIAYFFFFSFCFINYGGGSLVTKSYLTLVTPRNSVHGISQARILERLAISFSRGYSPPRDQIQVSCIAGKFFSTELPGKLFIDYTGLLNKLPPHSVGLKQQTFIISQILWAKNLGAARLGGLDSESLPRLQSRFGLGAASIPRLTHLAVVRSHVLIGCWPETYIFCHRDFPTRAAHSMAAGSSRVSNLEWERTLETEATVFLQLILR